MVLFASRSWPRRVHPDADPLVFPFSESAHQNQMRDDRCTRYVRALKPYGPSGSQRQGLFQGFLRTGSPVRTIYGFTRLNIRGRCTTYDDSLFTFQNSLYVHRVRVGFSEVSNFYKIRPIFKGEQLLQNKDFDCRRQLLQKIEEIEENLPFFSKFSSQYRVTRR